MTNSQRQTHEPPTDDQAIFIAACAAAQIALFVNLMMSRTLPVWRRVRMVSLANISIALIIVIAVYIVPMLLLGSPV